MVNGATENEVTYNGWPLHTYASDTAPGQTNGQGIERQVVCRHAHHNVDVHRHELDELDADRSTRDPDCEHGRRLWILTLTKCERLSIHRPELGPDRTADRHAPRDRRRVHRHHELDRAGARHRCRAVRTAVHADHGGHQHDPDGAELRALRAPVDLVRAGESRR